MKRSDSFKSLLNIYLNNGDIYKAHALTNGSLARKDAWKIIKIALEKLDYDLIKTVRELTGFHPCERTMSRLIGQTIRHLKRPPILPDVLNKKIILSKRQIDSLLYWVLNDTEYAAGHWLKLNPSPASLDKLIASVTYRPYVSYGWKEILFKAAVQSSPKGKKTLIQFCLKNILYSECKLIELYDLKEALKIAGRKIKKTEIERLILRCDNDTFPYLDIRDIAKTFELQKEHANLYFLNRSRWKMPISAREVITLGVSKRYLHKMRRKCIEEDSTYELKEILDALNTRLNTKESNTLLQKCIEKGNLDAYHLEELLSIISRPLTEEECDQFVEGSIKKSGDVRDGLKVVKLLGRALKDSELEIAKAAYLAKNS